MALKITLKPHEKLIIGGAVPELRARTYGAYYLIRDCVVTTGSFLGAWLWSISPRVNFVGAAVCGARPVRFAPRMWRGGSCSS